MPEWWIRDRGRDLGPYTREQILKLREDGHVFDYQECSRDDRRTWQTVGSIQELNPEARLSRYEASSSRFSFNRTAPPPLPNSAATGFLTPFRLILGAMVSVIVLAGIATVILVVRERPRITKTTEPKVVLNPAELLVSGLSDLSAKEQTLVRTETVGLVVTGVHIRFEDGSWVERPHGSGSGFVVSPAGYLLTNKHVIEEIEDFKESKDRSQLESKLKATITPKIWVFFGKETRCECTVVFQSADYDLAILDTKKANSRYLALCQTPDADIPHLKGLTAIGFPGNDRKAKKWLEGTQKILERGQSVQHSFDNTDFQFSVDSGDVRKTPIAMRVGGSPLAYYLVHSASTAHGNSGGPLLSKDGTVVGINTIIRPVKVKDTEGNEVLISQSGQNYALTLSQLKREIDRYVPNAVWRAHSD